MVMKPCEVCDDLSEQSRCEAHRPKPKPKPRMKQAGYDAQWKRISKQARKEQPFCLWCNTTKDLQTDHTPQAWERRAKGLAIRLEDVRVLCGACNREAGQARPGPGQRTSEDRPARPDNLPATGRLVSPGGRGSNVLSSIPVARQSLSNTPGGMPEDPVSGPW